MPAKKPKHIYKQFPFKHSFDENGNLFQTIKELKKKGYKDNQIWSVCEYEDKQERRWYVTGPSHHWLELRGYVGTKEKHDGNTYYHECIDD